MRTTSCVFVIALLIGSAVAQNAQPLLGYTHQKGQPLITVPHHDKGQAILTTTHHKGQAVLTGPYQKGQPLVTVAQKNIPGTPPHPINESDRKKQCPAGFEFVGKQCAKTLTAEPNTVCPHGTTLADGRCAKYVGKLSECPAGFLASKGTCVKTLTSEPETLCPEGFTLSGKDTCVRKLALDDRKVCPAGSVPKGDDCVTTSIAPPDFVCPSGYTIFGRRCQREETFDCTPARVLTNPGKEADQVLTTANHFRHEAPGKGKGDINRYTLPEAAPVVEEYVVQKTCKRVITEPARRICPDGGLLDGKVCRIEHRVEHVFKKGGFRDEFIPIIRQCPLGYAELDNSGLCQTTEEALPAFYCPGNTIDLGQRCAIYHQPHTDCPTGFSLEGKACVKTIFAAPIVEYTVTYSCTGKDCGGHHHHH